MHPPPGFEPPLVEQPVAPPDLSAADPFSAPRALVSDTVHAAAIDRAGRSLAVRDRERSMVLATSAAGFASVTLLPGEPAIVLSREGVWSGPVRAWILGRPELTTLSLPRATMVPAAPARAPVTQPYVYDETFARLWVRARTARAVFSATRTPQALAPARRPDRPSDAGDPQPARQAARPLGVGLRGTPHPRRAARPPGSRSGRVAGRPVAL
ncbi:MAG: hypothetical protein IPN17_17745 [Deltaproteobacteria bacterium]|nr:hypothetical protein [Deltaproteobacteria bacterium]